MSTKTKAAVFGGLLVLTGFVVACAQPSPTYDCGGAGKSSSVAAACDLYEGPMGRAEVSESLQQVSAVIESAEAPSTIVSHSSQLGSCETMLVSTEAGQELLTAWVCSTNDPGVFARNKDRLYFLSQVEVSA